MTQRDLFPAIRTNRTGHLELDGQHVMYWEESGNPDGLPVVFLHGGPGAGAGPLHRRFFDPKRYRIVVFHQRGCGKSAPIAELADNDTPHLVSDIERLREHLGIPSWVVFGGSWGSTLALAYAQAHPEVCLALILRGIFLGRASEIDWFLHGMRAVFPEAWRDFVEFLPEEERGDLLGSYLRRLTDPDAGVHQPAAARWARYEGACSTLMPNRAAAGGGGDAGALALARIEAHYMRHGLFVEEGELLANVGRIRHLPAVIVQGRYDMVCPPVTADELVRAWPEAEYVVVPDAGHSAMEPGIRSALVAATDSIARKLRQQHRVPA
jgi:proline iminopeptidase